jgi:hypothetical protein
MMLVKRSSEGLLLGDPLDPAVKDFSKGKRDQGRGGEEVTSCTERDCVACSGTGNDRPCSGDVVEHAGKSKHHGNRVSCITACNCNFR